MANPFIVNIQGMDKLQKKLNDLPKKLQREIDAEIDASANNIHAEQIRLVPVDEGRLKQSLSVKRLAVMERELVSNVFYASYMEFGTKTKVQVPAGLQEFAAQFKGPSGRGSGGFDEF